MMTRDAVRAFYDRFGAAQDRQGFYEDPATRDLVAHAEFGAARAVFELGCGTGRFAEELLAHWLSDGASYTGCDLSSTMVGLARRRLQRLGGRVRVEPTDGSLPLPMADAACDRFVSNYVLDLLPADDIAGLLREAHRILAPDGRLCLVSLTEGTTIPSRLVSHLWSRVHRRRPNLVGGCRPIELKAFVGEPHWHIEYCNVVVAWAVPSEVLVARRRPGVS